MESIIAKARDLAESILDSDTFKTLRKYESRVLQNDTTTEILKDYERQMMNLRSKEESKQAISPEEKHAFQDIQQRLATNQDLQLLMQAQTEYHRLMEAVNSTIHETLDPKAGQDSEGEAGEQEEPPEQSRIILP